MFGFNWIILHSFVKSHRIALSGCISWKSVPHNMPYKLMLCCEKIRNNCFCLRRLKSTYTILDERTSIFCHQKCRTLNFCKRLPDIIKNLADIKHKKEDIISFTGPLLRLECTKRVLSRTLGATTILCATDCGQPVLQICNSAV